MTKTLEETSNKIWNAGAKLSHNEIDEILESFAREIQNSTLDACREKLEETDIFLAIHAEAIDSLKDPQG